jgi:VCBS repeat-containing protein
MRDAAGSESMATATITIHGANDAPRAVDDAGETGEDQPLIVAPAGLLANDTDVDAGDTKSVVAVNGQPAAVGSALTLPSGAIVLVQSDGSYRYDPNGRFESLRSGQTVRDSFSYSMRDAAGSESMATATITIHGVNDAPRAVDDMGETGEDQSLMVAAPGLLANDSDVDAGDTKSVVAVNGQPAAVGSALTLSSGAIVLVRSDGSYRYDPNGRFESLRSGQSAFDSFTYSMRDAVGSESTATVTIKLRGVGGGVSSIAGSVYLDLNNNGIRDNAEMGMPNVVIALEGPVTRVVRTDAQGNYSFQDLAGGTYIVWEYHPRSFVDGIDSRGTPALGKVANDRFYDLQLSGEEQLVGYNFAELGLNEITKQLLLASTKPAWEYVLDVVSNDQPVSLDAQVMQSIQSKQSASAESVSTRHPLDTSNDGLITPLDAILVINALNARPKADAEASAEGLLHASTFNPMLDTSGDGVLNPLDAVLVINYLNRHRLAGNGEGEGDPVWNVAIDRDDRGWESCGSDPSQVSDPLDDLSGGESLLDLLSLDICHYRRKKRGASL